MDSQKVKEIKKALECHIQNEIEDTCEYCSNCPASDWDYEKECNIDLFQKTITLINDLESENERLTEERDLYKKQFNELEQRFFDLREENKELKDQIAELEKEIEENAFYSKGYAQGIKNTYEVVIPDKLKQFAERLKGKFEHCVGDIYHADTIDERIDETLKEFLGEKQ